MDLNTMDQAIQTGDGVKKTQALPEGSIAMACFSPPYDQLRDYENKPGFDSMALGHALHRALQDGGICAVVMQDESRNFAKSGSTFSLATDWCRHTGLRLFECCIYHRHGNPGAWWNSRFRVDHEYILLFLKGEKPKWFSKRHMMQKSLRAGETYRGTDRHTDGSTKPITGTVQAEKCPGTVWRYSASNTENNPLKRQHPATFPDALARDLILAFSQEGDTILDPMCGSGTTCVAAAQENRRPLGFDINPRYAKIARERLRTEGRPHPRLPGIPPP